MTPGITAYFTLLLCEACRPDAKHPARGVPAGNILLADLSDDEIAACYWCPQCRKATRYVMPTNDHRVRDMLRHGVVRHNDLDGAA